VINKALLHPWVRWAMQTLLEEGRKAGLNPVVTSAFRDMGSQRALLQRCQRGEGVRGFPVKDPLCSQHVWGFAFDMEAQRPPVVAGESIPLPGSSGSLTIAKEVFCSIFPDTPICAQAISTQDQTNAQFVLGLLAKQIGLLWVKSDAIHFFTFPRSAWDSHMRKTFNTSCETCHHPGGVPF